MFLEIYFLSIEDFINEIFFQCFKMFIIIINISFFYLSYLTSHKIIYYFQLYIHNTYRYKNYIYILY